MCKLIDQIIPDFLFKLKSRDYFQGYIYNKYAKKISFESYSWYKLSISII